MKKEDYTYHVHRAIVAGFGYSATSSTNIDYNGLKNDFAVPLISYLLEDFLKPEFFGFFKESAIAKVREELQQKSGISSEEVNRYRKCNLKMRFYKSNNQLSGWQEFFFVIPFTRSMVVNECTLDLLDKVREDIGIQMNNSEKGTAYNFAGSNISGGVFGSINDSEITYNIEKIISNDIESLSKFFEELHVPTSDIDMLKEALEQDHLANHNNSLGEHVSDWVGNMVKKTISKTWDFAEEKAVSVLISAISKFLGIPL